MSVVSKYPMPTPGVTQIINLPHGAKFLSVGDQDGVIVAWFEVDKDAPFVPRMFLTAGTGWDLPNGGQSRHFMGTIQMNGFVWHVFEVLQ